jgi:hypothetical protein
MHQLKAHGVEGEVEGSVDEKLLKAGELDDRVVLPPSSWGRVAGQVIGFNYSPLSSKRGMKQYEIGCPRARQDHR